MAEFLGNLGAHRLLSLFGLRHMYLELEGQPLVMRIAMRDAGHDRALGAHLPFVAQAGIGMALAVKADGECRRDPVAVAAELGIGHVRGNQRVMASLVGFSRTKDLRL